MVQPLIILEMLKSFKVWFKYAHIVWYNLIAREIAA